MAAALAVLLAPAVALGQAAALRQVANSTVRIETPTGLGSGTVVRDRGAAGEDVLTCAHVVKGDVLITVRTMDARGKTEEFPAHVVRVDAAHDLALLSVRGLALPALPLAAADPDEFSVLWEVSSPLGRQRTASPETVSLYGDEAGHWRLLGSNMVGSSGGAVVDGSGRLVCVFQGLWGADEPFGAMGRCVDRSTVATFLGR